MTDNLNEDIFDAVLQRAFCDYENEQLASYPDCEILAKMYPLPKKEKQAFDREVRKIKYGKSLVSVYLSRAAVVFLCIIALGTGVMMTSPTVRAAVRNVIVEWLDKYSVFTILNTELGSNDFVSVEDVEIGYVPDGFELVDSDLSNADYMCIYSSCTNKDNYYTVTVFENESNTIYTDNEHSKYQELLINNHESWLIYDEENKYGSLILVGSKISISISGKLPKNELIKIAESIK
ncbi:MAG: DUF4367 domain-containing protein [Faecalibacterium sp.]|nr:DUF4367 domain-containing protein [Ruminococcus flavefaciens]MCM1363235.1 DUF4367 domain-containing protein [Clostridiales bacterium]MCM1484622.1 DUF4367 domain-containing protein [Faecalibacterium sp.]